MPRATNAAAQEPASWWRWRAVTGPAAWADADPPTGWAAFEPGALFGAAWAGAVAAGGAVAP